MLKDGRLIVSEGLKISILGAGWLGLPLAVHFSELGNAVKLSTRSQNRLDNVFDEFSETYKVDIENLSENFSFFLETDILIINITSKNIEAFRNLITEIEKSPVQNVLFVSSTSVYNNVNDIVTEESGDENDAHPLYKIEQLFRESKNFDTTILRFSGLVGYQRHPGNWFKNKPVSQPDAMTNLIHRDDCIGIIQAIIQQQAWGEVFNGSSSIHYSKREYYSAMRALVSDVPLEFNETTELSYKTVSNKKVINQLAYDFVYPDLMRCRNFRVVL